MQYPVSGKKGSRWCGGWHGPAVLPLLFLWVLLAKCSAAAPYAIPPPNKTQNCQYGVSLEWATRVGSAVFATPAIADLMHDGKKEILLPTFSQYLEAVNGANGEDVSGYPFVHPKLKAYASPLPVDVDGDGRTEWLVAMYTGDLVLFSEEGKARGLLRVPSLAVKKHWMTMPRNASFPIGNVATVRASAPRLSASMLADVARAKRIVDLTFYTPRTGMNANHNSSVAGRRTYGQNARQQWQGQRGATARGAEPAAVTADPDIGALAAGLNEAPPAAEELRADILPVHVEDYDDEDYDADDDFYYYGHGDVDPLGRHSIDEYALPKPIGPHGHMSPEARASMSVLFDPEQYRAKLVFDEEKDAFSTQHLRAQMNQTLLEDEVAVDAHILSTPRIVDIDGNGELDIILHVSYFFDEEEYRSPLFVKTPLPDDVDPANFVATAVVCMSLLTGELKWVHVLDLVTKRDADPTYALSSPLVVNADSKDTALEIYVTSSSGRVTGLSSAGKPLPGWPVWMGPLAASPSAEDLLGNGELSVLVGDMEGGVKCLSPQGALLWQRNVIGGVADQITFGDVNGDGIVDVVFGTSAGLIYALDGRNGEPLRHFPVVTRGSIVAPVLLLALSRHRSAAIGPMQVTTFTASPMSLVVPSHDGNIYLIDGRNGCVETIDIDEKSSSMVLADDLTGNGHMDLLVTTINGGVYVFETMSEYHPLKAWPSKTKGLNGNSAGEGGVGVYIVPAYRHARHVQGDRFRLKIAIEDSRRQVKLRQRYAVSVFVGSRIRVFQGVFHEAKEHTIHLRTPLQRMYSSVTVVMTLPNGQVFTDTISLGFNMHFLTTIKYLLVIPFLFIAAALMLVHKRHEVELE